MASCPHGITLNKNKVFIVGCILGISLTGSVGGAGIILAFIKIFSGM